MEIYSIDREGPYKDIYNFRMELKACFKRLPKDAKWVTIFIDRKYSPKKARMKFGLLIEKGMELKSRCEDSVKKETIPSYKCLSYTHIGDTTILSLLWDELGRYRDSKGYKSDNTLPFWCLEYYFKDLPLDSEEEFIAEINLPIE